MASSTTASTEIPKPIPSKPRKGKLCEHPDCLTRAGFGYPETRKRTFCGKHKLSGMICVISRPCQHPGCTIRPSYAHISEKKAQFCKLHKEADMVDVIGKKCGVSGCSKTPTFGNAGEKRAERCKSHAEPGMIDIKNKRCEFSGCSTIATYALHGEPRARRCKKHIEVGMVDVKSKRCKHPNCMIQASYDCAGGKGKFCKIHATDDMVLVKKKSCEAEGCTTVSTYAAPGEKRARRCKKHMDTGMIRVYSYLCDYSGCNVMASFAIAGEKIPRRCVNHKDDAMINIFLKSCIHDGCSGHAYYGLAGEEVKYCAIHATDDMVRKMNKCDMCHKFPRYGYMGDNRASRCREHADTNMVDVTRSQCKHDGCNVRAGFGKLFSPKQHCHKHKLPNEYSKNNPTCLFEGCSIRPTHTNKGDNYPLRCFEHSAADDKNVVEKICGNCGLIDLLNEDVSLCNDCSDFIVKKVHKAKETKIKTLFQANGLKYSSYDRPVVDGCTKYRPDFIFDRGTYYIIVEVDENQHKSYACECEQMRMVMIWQDMGGVPVIFIRFNPDTYISHDGNIVREYKSRELKLLTFLRSFDNIETLPHQLMVSYLYYDGFTGNCELLVMSPDDGKVSSVKLDQ